MKWRIFSFILSLVFIAIFNGMFLFIMHILALPPVLDTVVKIVGAVLIGYSSGEISWSLFRGSYLKSLNKGKNT